MHSLAHFMPQMALPGSAHAVSQPPSVMAPPQMAAHAASMPPGFPSFVMTPASGGTSAMPWPLVSQPPHSAQAVAAAVPEAGPGLAMAPEAQAQAGDSAAQPVEAQAEVSQASEVPSSGAFSALLEDHAAQPQDAAKQEAVKATDAAQLAQDPLPAKSSIDSTSLP